MKLKQLLKILAAISIGGVVFSIFYKTSDRKGLKRIWFALRAAFVFITASSDFNPEVGLESRALVNNSHSQVSTLIKNPSTDELAFLEKTTKTILVKDGSLNGFANGFLPTPALPKRPTSPGTQTTTGMGGSMPGKGNGGGSGSGNAGPTQPPALTDPNPKLSHQFAQSPNNQKKKRKKKEYSDVMEQLEKQKNSEVVVVKIGERSYELKNPNKRDAMDLESELAELIYSDIRQNKKDVAEIAKQNGLDKNAIKKCKRHIFINKHKLDQYEALGDKTEYKRFAANLHQALGWLRFIDGVPTEEDREWLRHEFAEQKYEHENNAGYRESHEHAQKLYNGDPWLDRWRFGDDYHDEL